jgi:hypothetical protein
VDMSQTRMNSREWIAARHFALIAKSYSQMFLTLIQKRLWVSQRSYYPKEGLNGPPWLVYRQMRKQ